MADLALNVPQQLFAIFFAIFWGTSSNVWPRWKPFQWPLIFRSGRVFARVALSVVVLNLLPLAFFIWALRSLAGKVPASAFDTFGSACCTVLPAVVPAFAVFGFYRLWLSIVEARTTWFYYRDDAERERDLKRKVLPTVEPTIASLGPKQWGAWPNFWIAVLYIAAAGVGPMNWRTILAYVQGN